MHVKHTKILFHGIESNAGYISVLIVVTTCFYRAGFIYLYPYWKVNWNIFLKENEPLLEFQNIFSMHLVVFSAQT